MKKAQRMAKLDAVPSIVRVWDVFQENDTAYIVMDFVEGVTLKRYIKDHGVIHWTDCFTLLEPILESLAVMMYYCLIGKVIPEVMDRLLNKRPIQFSAEHPLSFHVVAELTWALELETNARTRDMREFKRQLTSAYPGYHDVLGGIYTGPPL
ncbi:MAG: hypothetical protein LUE14_03125 [Clostridiales bacterium]|nr:hypothetical protein [Clostridiales bacterium]